MSSLLSEEIKKYNNSNNLKSNNYTCNTNNTTTIHKCSSLTNIENNYLTTNEYCLNKHFFNPMKNSPPNDWQCRLMKRITSLNFID